MNKKIFLILAMANLFLVGAVLAQDILTNQEAAQYMSAKMGQVMEGGVGSSKSISSVGNVKGGDASAGVIIVFDPRTNTFYRYPKNNMPSAGVFPAPTIWPAPDMEKVFLWNGLTKEQVLAFRRKWTLKEVEGALRPIPYKGGVEFLWYGVIGSLFGTGPEYGKGFQWQECLIDGKLRPAEKGSAIEIKVSGVDDVNEAKYTLVGFSAVNAESNLIPPQTVMCSLMRLFPYDVDMVFLSSGTNPVNTSTSFSPGGSLVSGGVQNTFALVGSLTTGGAKVIGEPAVILLAYREKEDVSDVSSSQPTKREPVEVAKEEEIPGVKVSPALQQLYKKGEVNGGFQEAELNQMKKIWKHGAGSR